MMLLFLINFNFLDEWELEKKECRWCFFIFLRESIYDIVCKIEVVFYIN